MRRFHSFTIHFSIQAPFPVTEHLLCSFAAYLADQGLAPQTIRSYLSAVRNTQLALGFPDPRDHSSLPILKRVQAGIQRVRSMGGPPSRLRLPITVSVMERIKTHLDAADTPHKELMWAICCTAFFGFFRLGELLPESKAKINQAVSLMWGDVAVDSREKPTMIKVHLKRSKCDQFGAGADITMGATGLPLCPVTAILQYIGTRGATQEIPHTTGLKTLVCGPVAGHVGSGGPASAAVRRTQLPNRGSYDGGYSWDRGLYNPNPGALAKLCIPPVHPLTK